EHPAGGGHEERSRGALAGDVGEYQSPAAIGERNEVVPVASDGARGDRKTRDRKPWNQRRTARQQSLLNSACFLGFAGETLVMMAFVMKTAGVLHRDRYV